MSFIATKLSAGQFACQKNRFQDTAEKGAIPTTISTRKIWISAKPKTMKGAILDVSGKISADRVIGNTGQTVVGLSLVAVLHKDDHATDLSLPRHVGAERLPAHGGAMMPKAHYPCHLQPYPTRRITPAKLLSNALGARQINAMISVTRKCGNRWWMPDEALTARRP